MTWRVIHNLLVCQTIHGVVKNPIVHVSSFALCMIFELTVKLCNVVFIVKSCRALAEPTNGKKESNFTFCDITVDFTCDECYSLEGHYNLSCLPNNSWSGEEPNCTC